MNVVLPWAGEGLTPPGGPLDGAHRQWPESNCYVDLWLTALLGWGLEARAMLGFLAAIDHEGDQFTFVRPPHADLETLYGVRVEELALFRSLEEHLLVQCGRGNMVLVEADGHWLPDTRGSGGYRQGHTKTTIGVLSLDPAARSLCYLHNRGRFVLDGADYDGVLRRDPAPVPGMLPPLAEIAKRGPVPARGPVALAEESRRLLRRHLARLPAADPLSGFAARFEDELRALRHDPAGAAAAFHLWSFATLRQLGAAFELLGAQARWLGAVLGVDATAAARHCDAVAGGAKALQFRAARLSGGRGEARDAAPALDALRRDRCAALGALAERFG